MRGNIPDIRGARKVRKPRGRKKDGSWSMDLCPYCYSFNCDSVTMSRKFQNKISRRFEQGVHPACGTNPCTCRSGIDARPQFANDDDRKEFEGRMNNIERRNLVIKDEDRLFVRRR